MSSQHASSLKKGFSRLDPSAKGTSIPFFSSGLDKILSNPFRKRPMQTTIWKRGLAELDDSFHSCADYYVINSVVAPRLPIGWLSAF